MVAQVDKVPAKPIEADHASAMELRAAEALAVKRARKAAAKQAAADA